MTRTASLYKRHRFPPEIIQYTVWLYYRFNLSHRDIEDLLAEPGITVSREAIRLWCNKFGPQYAKRLKRRHQAQRFLGVHAAVYNLFNLGRHLVLASHYRSLRQGAFVSWEKAVAV